jgi:hypothetical protein
MLNLGMFIDMGVNDVFLSFEMMQNAILYNRSLINCYFELYAFQKPLILEIFKQN